MEESNAILTGSRSENSAIMTCVESHWYCVYTKPRQEEFASLHLKRQGFETFLPLLRTRRSVRAQMRWAISPLFPRYLFARIRDEELLAKVRSTLGVASLVSFGGIAAEVPEDVVGLIQGRCEGDTIIAREMSLQRGDRLSIISGPYSGMRAIFERETTCAERVVILLEVMATVAKITIDRGFLRPEGHATGRLL